MALTRINNNSLSAVTAAGIPNKPGSVIQVVHDTSLARVSWTGTSYAAVGLDATITPTSTSSKMLITVTAHLGAKANSITMATLYRGNTAIALPTHGGSYNATLLNYPATDGNGMNSTSIMWLDEPTTTQQITYSLKVRVPNSGDAVYLNGRSSDGAFGGASSITVMEIAG
jgi:hypothetical protein